MPQTDLAALSREIAGLVQAVATEGDEIAAPWASWIAGSDYAPSALNLAHYLALRHRDLRPLQERLMTAGLSSLGRMESRVMATLDAVGHILALACKDAVPPARSAAGDFFAGRSRIAAQADTLLGAPSRESPVRLMVTLPSQAAEDPDFLLRLAALGVEAVRINCAHDDEAAWAAMIAHVARARDESGRRMRIVMDLPGPKIRTGRLRAPKPDGRVEVGDMLALARPGRLEAAPPKRATIECTLAAALDASRLDHRIHIDDGKLSTRVIAVEDWGLLVRVEAGPGEKGYKLKPEKGVNFPDAELAIAALTDDDRAILPFVARHADAIDYSFVQTAEDVADLQAELDRIRPEDWQALGLILKVETSRAVRNLPAMVVRAAARQPTGVMIARGDLAVEIGFARVAEMQEEILWLCEAAQVPVIWATQVMESFLKTGLPTRGEMTDVAMAARCEGMMLNKGAHLFDGIRMIDQLHHRMNDHMSKKAHLLRPLRSW